VAVAAHLVDNVFPRLPVRQWVLSFPKRRRYFLRRAAELAGRVRRVFLREVEATRRAASPGAPADARFGGVTFGQRFGSALNAPLHFPCCLIDGVFAAAGDGMRFDEATALDESTVATVQQTVRARLLDLFEKDVDAEATANMRGWEHAGSLLDATIRIEAGDRAGLERLLRSCARPPFASERLRWEKRSQPVISELPKPRPNAPRAVILDPLDLVDRLVGLIAPPRIYEVFPLVCPNCKGEMGLIGRSSPNGPPTSRSRTISASRQYRRPSRRPGRRPARHPLSTSAWRPTCLPKPRRRPAPHGHRRSAHPAIREAGKCTTRRACDTVRGHDDRLATPRSCKR
jgi:hypothetical protein